MANYLIKKLPYEGGLVTIDNDRVVTNSLTVARVFEKNHNDILKSIRKLDSAREKFPRLYESSTYKDAQGKPRPMYIMDKDGFVLLVMGFTGRLALDFKIAYIQAFNEMEKILKESAGTEYAAKLLDEHIAELNAHLLKAVAERKNLPVPYGDILLGIIPTKGDLEHKLRTMFAQLTNFFLDAYSLASKKVDAEEGLARLDAELQQLRRKIR